jgi:hypothetical protein
MPEAADSAPSLSAKRSLVFRHTPKRNDAQAYELKDALQHANDPIGLGAWCGLSLNCLQSLLIGSREVKISDET